MDGRRHSVDIPISKALVALRRVRSLRDPSTNCSSRLSPLLDGSNWETKSSNGITLGFANGGIDDDNSLGLKDLGSYGQRREHNNECEVYYSKRKYNSKLDCDEYIDFAGYCPSRAIQEEPNSVLSNQEESYLNTLPSEKYCRDSKDIGLSLMKRTSYEKCLEGSVQEERMDENASKRDSQYRSRIRSRGRTGDVMSRTGSPCLSMDDAPVENSSGSPSLHENEDSDVYPSHQGCGISRCWSRTPRFRESDFSSELEERPLMSEEVRFIDQSKQRRSQKHIGKEAIPYSDGPRSLHQKFRPKFFSEVVGQNVVASSLLSAIANERILPFYLFHGPRGTGKTSSSRIFAAALNCLSHEESKPCGMCQDCLSFFSGRSRDVKEVDSVRINRVDKIRWIIKSASAPPVSSRHKVFIIDECHLLRGSTWATILNAADSFSRHVVFIMITPDLDKLPRSVVSKSQRYHFPKIKESDCVCKLRKICVEEGIEFDHNALDFIAAKSGGSLRDAEMMLEQLSLLGKKITISIAYELVGMVSDEELLGLLDLALSSDTANTVKRARELMRSRIDPMHLTSQLANIIMDILAGNCLDGASEAKRNFMRRHSSEADVQHLSHALKILSETEKQLRTSKNQTTWLTVALLQLNSGSPTLNANETRLCRSSMHTREGDFCSSSYSEESLKHLVTCACGKCDSCKMGIHEGKGTLESVWSRATEICESKSLRKFLQKKGRLASVCFNEGLAVTELEFSSHAHVVKAEKSWKLIAAALQSTLRCNVEIRINLLCSNNERKSTKVKKASFSLFSCSRRMSQSTIEHGSDPSENYTSVSEKPMIKEKSVATCSSDCGSQQSRICCHAQETIKTLRDNDGNALSVETTTSYRLLPDNIPEPGSCGYDCSNEEEINRKCHNSNSDITEEQPGCFSRTMNLHKKLHPSDKRKMIVFSKEQQKNLALPNHDKTLPQTYFCASDPYSYSSSCKNYAKCDGNEDSQGRKDSRVFCWRTPTFPFKKAWQLRHQQPQKLHLVGWVFPCAAAK